MVVLEIYPQNSECCLRKPDEHKEVSHLIGQWMSPKNLVQVTYVIACFIHSFPYSVGSQRCSKSINSPHQHHLLISGVELKFSLLTLVNNFLINFFWILGHQECRD